LKKISDFQCGLKALRNQFDDVWSKSEGHLSEAEVRVGAVPKKRQRIQVGNKTAVPLLIADTVTRQSADTYADVDQLQFLSFLNCGKCGQYVNKFPYSAFHSLKKSYGRYF
jgi:hypothetical protein